MPLTPAKTASQTVIALTKAASGALTKGTTDVSGAVSGFLAIHFGRRATTALTAAVVFRVDASPATSGDDTWAPIYGPWSSDTTACESEAVSGTVAAGTDTITVASTTNLTNSDKLFFDNGTTANCEWHRMVSLVSNTSVTIEENLTNAQTGSTIYDRAEWWGIPLDLEHAMRIRVVVDGTQGGQAYACRALRSTFDGTE
jgi:hypothetical protein